MRVLVGLAVCLLALVPGRAEAAAVHYYLSLGDSLAAGYLAGEGATDAGYADQLYATLRQHDPQLRLVKLGCGGETTATMISGGRCSYPAGSQLRQAVRFLRQHGGAVRYVTVDIGANDIGGCWSATAGVDGPCVRRGLRSGVGNLARIIGPLYRADPRVRGAGMTYYDPFLGLWQDGALGRLAAAASVDVLQLLGGLQAAEYAAFGYRVADVFAAFSTAALNRTGGGGLPRAVATVCRLTTMCSRRDVHATAAGYALIARTFAAALR